MNAHARPVIVRLTSRRVKQQILRGEKNLKNNTAIRDDDTFLEKVTVVEDLTNAKARLLKFTNDLQQTNFAYAKDGVIICKMRNGKFGRLETPDDLFKRGVDDVRCSDFYPHLY